MSLITCCPACGTMFRVVPDQLKISEGWVRCGHCSEVFDATTHMMTEAAAGVQPDLDPPPPPLESDTVPPDEAPADHHARETVRTAVDSQAADSALDESPLDQPFVFRRSDLGLTEDLPSVSPPGEAPQSLPPSHPPSIAPAEDEAALGDVSFIRQARRREYWRRPGVRVVLGLFVLVLAQLLGVQYAVTERDRLAAAEPGLKPVLQELCKLLRCEIGPPRQIETLAIESSSFNKVRSDAYRLNFTLKNNAPMPVAVPAMELTLTDGQDQPVLRRVLVPPEMGASAPLIPAGSEWTASVGLAVNNEGQGGRIAGYRLLAFYP